MNVIFKLILAVGFITLFFFLRNSFRKNPYAYRNIAVTSVMILLLSMIPGDSVLSGILSGEKLLFIPVSLLCLFLCISNAALLKNEGFRRNNLLGLIFSSLYLISISIVWRPLNSLPAAIGRFHLFYRLMLCYAECTILAICITGYAVLRVKPVYDRDFVIILGCSISKKGKLRPLLKSRVNRAIRFAWDQEVKTGKPVKYVPSGGQGSDEPMSEGSAMEMYLLSHSAENYEIFTEKESKNTRENLIFSKRIIDARMENPKVMIVTTNFHVLRSGMLARRAGLMNTAVTGSSTKWYFWPNAFFREMVAIILMFPRVHIAVAAFFAIVSLLHPN